jgi:hypothetical protein
VREDDNLPPYSADVKKSRSLNSPRPLWACMACNGCALPLPLPIGVLTDIPPYVSSPYCVRYFTSRIGMLLVTADDISF